MRWESSGEANVYRVGCRGKVDLKCVEEGHGGAYYRDHLPVLGMIFISLPYYDFFFILQRLHRTRTYSSCTVDPSVLIPINISILDL